MEAVMFPATFEKYRDVVVEDAVVRIRAKVERSDRGTKLIVHDVQPFDDSGFNRPPGKVIVTTEAAAFKNGRVDRLKEIMRHYPGRDSLEIHLVSEGGTKTYRLPEGVERDSNGLHAELLEVFGGDAVREL
jgi:DNA polymerase III alpha subunit